MKQTWPPREARPNRKNETISPLGEADAAEVSGPRRATPTLLTDVHGSARSMRRERTGEDQGRVVHHVQDLDDVADLKLGHGVAVIR